MLFCYYIFNGEYVSFQHANNDFNDNARKIFVKVPLSRHKVIKNKKECLMTNYNRINFLPICEDMPFALCKFALFNSVKIIVINEG